MRINEMCKRANENAVAKGFYEDIEILELLTEGVMDHEWDALYQTTIATRLMLIVSEAGEAVEAMRRSRYAEFHEELADIAIRLGDLCGWLKIDLEAEIEKKMTKNESREYKHGKQF